LVCLFGLFALSGCATAPVSQFTSHNQLIDVSQTASNAERMSVRIAGQGRPLVLVHGLGGNHLSWRRIAPLLKNDFRVIVPEQIGFGASDKPVDADYRLAAQADRLIVLIRRLERRKVVLVGDSTGGTLALLIALKAPDLVSKLVLIGAPLAVEDLPAVQALAPIADLAEVAMWLTPPTIVSAIGSASIYPFGYLPTAEEIALRAHSLREPGGYEATIRTGRALFATNSDGLRDKIGTIAAPTLLIWCRNDSLVPLSQARELHEKLPNARLELLGHCDHAGHYLEGERISSLVRGFAPR
jgi:pimeloyl-ACP methyl ester carboxylesterase